MKTKQNFSVKSNTQKRTFSIKCNGNKYRTLQFSQAEFEEKMYYTQGDWEHFLKSKDYYYLINAI